jgi:hypothetical protein
MMDYLVRYASSRNVGRFSSDEIGLVRGDSVILNTNRGLEYGEVLAPGSGLELSGSIIRKCNSDDHHSLQLIADRSSMISQQIIEIFSRFNSHALDLELLFDNRTLIVELITLPGDELIDRIQALEEEFNVEVRWVRSVQIKEPEIASGCSTCGSESGGCGSCGSTGSCGTSSCSSGKVSSAAELTNYFANLRKEMERQSSRIGLASI